MKVEDMNTFLEAADEHATAASTHCQTNPPRRILVVEDDRDVRQFSRQALLRSGYQVDTAEDGAAGWDALHASGYDLLITDNQMPKVSGVELVRKLRAARMALPVIMASAALPITDAEHQRLNLSASLQKPFSAYQLLETVKVVLQAAAHSGDYTGRVLPVRV